MIQTRNAQVRIDCAECGRPATHILYVHRDLSEPRCEEHAARLTDRLRMPRMGMAMLEVLDTVAEHPGVGKLAVARWVDPHGDHKHAYRAIDRVINAGLVSARHDHAGGYELHLTQLGRTIRDNGWLR